MTEVDALGQLEGVRAARDGSTLRVTLCSPGNRNAQTPATWRRLAALRGLVDDGVRAVVLDAEGPSFCAGLDRRMLSAEGVPGQESLLSLATRDQAQQDAFVRQAQSALTWWREVPAVTVALVSGHAIGAGFQLALACDWIVVGDDAQLAMRETSLGLVPDLGGTAALVDRVGYARALEICATGRFVGADEAVRIGLAVTKAAEPSTAADELLAPVLAALPGAVAELKALLRAAAGDREASLARERAAQIRRLAELRVLLGG